MDLATRLSPLRGLIAYSRTVPWARAHGYLLSPLRGLIPPSRCLVVRSGSRFSPAALRDFFLVLTKHVQQKLSLLGGQREAFDTPPMLVVIVHKANSTAPPRACYPDRHGRATDRKPA